MERTMKIERHSQDFVLLIDLLRKSTLYPIKTPKLASKFFIFMKQRQLSPLLRKKDLAFSARPEIHKTAPSGTRTLDPLIKSQLLYQLS